MNNKHGDILSVGITNDSKIQIEFYNSLLTENEADFIYLDGCWVNRIVDILKVLEKEQQQGEQNE